MRKVGPDQRVSSDLLMQIEPDQRVSLDLLIKIGPNLSVSSDLLMKISPDQRVSSNLLMNIGPDKWFPVPFESFLLISEMNLIESDIFVGVIGSNLTLSVLFSTI